MSYNVFKMNRIIPFPKTKLIGVTLEIHAKTAFIGFNNFREII